MADVLRILVATDCHLGFMEKDEVRRNDSFVAFEEICRLASEREVDFLLLGGDLFHENKPSRTTLVRAIEILRRFCLNDRPVQFQVVSDQTLNFANTFGHVNYEDENFNVGMPVFTIHGNHDDPAGVDNLSAIDILSACNLVNYFGKMVLGGNGVGQILLHPILLRKGTTRVALYGLGNIRDERLNRMFQTPHAVQWVRPEEQPNLKASDWFNIFVLHQNRVKSNPKNAVSEQFLARFLDFVIWGHEHECLVDPQEAAGMGFHISQPGSSVATSLIEGEAKQKHALLLEIKGNQYRPSKLSLRTVRPFQYADVSLSDAAAKLDPNDPNCVVQFLEQEVLSMVERANQQWTAQQVQNSGPVASGSMQPPLPLIRIRVDYTGFSTINPQRFGQKFVGKVANPHDILLFTKAARKRQHEDALGSLLPSDALRPEELNQQNIEALLQEANPQMEILPVNELGLALHDYVSKDDKNAFSSLLQDRLERMQAALMKEAKDQQGADEEERIREKVSRLLVQDEAFKEAHAVPAGSRGSEPVSAPSPSPGLGENHGEQDDDDFADGVTVKDRGAGRGRAAARGARGRGGRGRGRAEKGLKQTTLLASSQRSQRSQVSKGAGSSRGRKRQIEADDVEEEEEEEDEIASDSEDPEEVAAMERDMPSVKETDENDDEEDDSNLVGSPAKGKQVANRVTRQQQPRARTSMRGGSQARASQTAKATQSKRGRESEGAGDHASVGSFRSKASKGYSVVADDDLEGEEHDDSDKRGKATNQGGRPTRAGVAAQKPFTSSMSQGTSESARRWGSLRR